MDIITLFLAVSLYFTKNKVFSIILFFALSFSFFNIIPSFLLITKSTDCALLFVLFVTLVNAFTIKDYFYYGPLATLIRYFLLFLVISSCFSFFVLHFSIPTIVQGSRDYYLILSYFFLVRQDKIIVYSTLKFILVITFATSLLYIGQMILKRPILVHYTDRLILDSSTGLPRFYNLPYFTSLVLFISLFYYSKLKFKKIVFIGVSLIAIILTLGRTSIVLTMSMIVLGYLIKGNTKYLLIGLVFVFVLSIPLLGFLVNRFNQAGTSSDFQMLFNGNLKNFDMVENSDATMTYRIAWCVERISYLINKGFGSVLFGVGFIGDMDPKVHKLFNFYLGLQDYETGLISQIKTPDIAFGNIIARLGFLGGWLWMLIWIRLTKIFYNLRENKLIFCFYIYIVGSLIGSISGVGISDTIKFFVFFLILSLIINNDEKSFDNYSLL